MSGSERRHSDAKRFAKGMAMQRGDKGWDHFCELLVAIPGLADVFKDFHPEDGNAAPQYKTRRPARVEARELADKAYLRSEHLHDRGVGAAKKHW